MARSPTLAAALGRSPRINHVCDDWSGKQGLVAAGIGVMLYPTLAGQAALRPDIRLLSPSPRLLTRKLFVAALPEKLRAPAVTAFIDVMHDRVSSTMQWQPVAS